METECLQFFNTYAFEILNSVLFPFSVSLEENLEILPRKYLKSNQRIAVAVSKSDEKDARFIVNRALLDYAGKLVKSAFLKFVSRRWKSRANVDAS